MNLTGKRLYEWYRFGLSDFLEEHGQGKLHQYDIKSTDGRQVAVPIVKLENVGPDMAIDEKMIGEEICTVLSNRQTGKIALLAETVKTEDLSEIISRHFQDKQQDIKSITADLAQNYDWLARTSFFMATRVADKFHILQHGFTALQDIRVRYRQQHLTEERLKFEKWKQQQQKGEQSRRPTPVRLPNGETHAQLLARSRYLLFKSKDTWTIDQRQRAEILFQQYPDLLPVYEAIQQFRTWYNYRSKMPPLAKEELHQWYDLVDNINISELSNFKSMLEKHEGKVLNYFLEGKTNAQAEALNRKIASFLQFNYGIRDKDFFYFRLKHYYA